MLKHAFLLILLIFFIAPASAQKYEWAAKVVKVSSQVASGAEPYSPNKVLSVPNAYPQGQLNSEAWSPKKKSSAEYIEVRFARSMKVRQIAVVESFNPGAVSKIQLVDTKGARHEVYANNNPGPLPQAFRVLALTLPETPYRVIGAIVTLNAAKVDGINQIDAIGIADTEESFVKQDLLVKQEIAFDSVLENLGPNINSKYTEVRPVISPDGKTLFFARQGHPKNSGGRDDPQDVWVAQIADVITQKWGEAKRMGLPINNEESNGVASVSPDGNTLLLINTYNADNTINPEGASLSTRTANGWSFPVKLNIQNYYNNSKEQVDFYLSNTGKTLLMAVQRDDGAGSQDLYVSFLQKFGVWSKPLNLGRQINTKGAEFAPFLAADEKTLYFASDGHKGYGKSDIFYSKRLDDTWQNWSAPKNLGATVNSADWDAYYTISAAGDHAYLVSTKNSINNSRDIYKIGLVEQFKPEAVILITGRVLDSKTGKPLDAVVRYESLVTGEELGVARTNPADGTYTIVLPSGTNYGYMAEAEGYMAVSENLDATELTKYGEESHDLYLVPLEVGQKIKLNNIFFAQSRYDLRESSYSELNRLVKIMKDYPTIEILLEGHTDNQGSPKLNKELSENRVNEVRKYLIAKGIDKKRIQAVGHGGAQPVASNAKEETRRMNRRVEFTILKK